MKPGASTLNPYAASYIPLSKRNAGDNTEVPGVTLRGVKFVNAQNSYHDKASHHSHVHVNEKLSLPEVSTLKGHTALSSHIPNEMRDKQMVDMEFDMDMEYLRMLFPGVSDQSLADVYLHSGGDMDTTMDMLNHLECYFVESSDNLPDTLDIGDVAVSGSSAECSSSKLKNAVDKARPL
ncbi:polyadenylate-binding protein-interacting protein 6 [Tripterygium wilfordii]|uniref:Polyadenylate-binding protein-interacting protein 6 n=1 Tax=Tripterygium wilfordii TaxID=458696 RepID=A0A7J7DPC9_TRIWF|nr:polyadenylate-binding protein-interacting protein 5-like [Tripterygium wilfordii]XP_038698605.1 polyadenylate-binding protein-interacting protein 5-like [Tripterygium wilfordii]KAF5748230.1 polyadenylate-binding protein-interacting protein 6 [Tripterygium wilfordii]